MTITNFQLEFLRSYIQISCSPLAHDRYLLKDRFVRINVPNIQKPSIFLTNSGHLYKRTDSFLHHDHLYCKLCFDRVKGDEPDSSPSLIRKHIGVYSMTSSTGNRRHQVLSHHQITEHVQLTLMSHSKEKVIHQFTLMCCRDLLSIYVVEIGGRSFSLSIPFAFISIESSMFTFRKSGNYSKIAPPQFSMASGI